MDTMFQALKKAGLATDNDMDRVVKEYKQAEVEAEDLFREVEDYQANLKSAELAIREKKSIWTDKLSRYRALCRNGMPKQRKEIWKSGIKAAEREFRKAEKTHADLRHKGIELYQRLRGLQKIL